jgi:hypothetical protein
VAIKRVTKWPVILLGALACVGVLSQIWFEAGEIADGGTQSMMVNAVFGAQALSAVLLLAATVFATARNGLRIGLALASSCVAALCPLWIAFGAFRPSAWHQWDMAIRKFPAETRERLLIILLPAVFTAVFCGFLFNRLRTARQA